MEICEKNMIPLHFINSSRLYQPILCHSPRTPHSLKLRTNQTEAG
jgi:hypothetical protein